MPSEEPRMVNAVFGFCVRTDRWPSPLAALGYVPCGVEREIRVVRDGADHSAVADFVCASAQGQHVLCVEAKSRTVHEQQARSYLAIRPLHLVQTANLPPGMEPVQLTHDIAYATSAGNAESVAAQLAGFSALFPAIAGSEQRFGLVSGTFRQPDMQSVFATGIEITEAEWPTHFVLFNSRSEHGDIAPHLARAVSQSIIAGRGFSANDLARRTANHWSLCGPREQQGIRAALVRLTDDAVRNELSGYYEREMPAQTWRPTGPRPINPQALARLSRRDTDFVMRIQAAGVQPPPPIQVGFPDPSSLAWRQLPNGMTASLRTTTSKTRGTRDTSRLHFLADENVMPVRQVSPHPVFPSGDYQDLAEIRCSPEELVRRHGVNIAERHDDLDAFKLAAIVLADDSQAWLIKYRGDQYPGTLVRVDAAANPVAAQHLVAQALDLDDQDFSWLAPGRTTASAAT